ncbi:hypothetical protein FTUN_2815 [Frigoriglobus tundricola]|uniref:Uncharacterized protein n=1 Tax=Frigoriglobus tundricola TaxID=2774151 RepID=A0A6M5YPQ1_9BACT|nr:hypothetical protein FTUN_2815 [Frigoriglobus tundricola]
MRYHDECQDRRVPLGSGITEAVCKTIFTQRPMLCGTRWTEAGLR